MLRGKRLPIRHDLPPRSLPSARPVPPAAGILTCSDDPSPRLARPRSWKLRAMIRSPRSIKPFPESLVVKVEDVVEGQPVAGVMVAWTAEGDRHAGHRLTLDVLDLDHQRFGKGLIRPRRPDHRPQLPSIVGETGRRGRRCRSGYRRRRTGRAEGRLRGGRSWRIGNLFPRSIGVNWRRRRVQTHKWPGARAPGPCACCWSYVSGVLPGMPWLIGRKQRRGRCAQGLLPRCFARSTNTPAPPASRIPPSASCHNPRPTPRSSPASGPPSP